MESRVNTNILNKPASQLAKRKSNIAGKTELMFLLGGEGVGKINISSEIFSYFVEKILR